MVFCWHVLLEYDVPSPERGERFTEHYLGTPFHTVTDGTDTGMVGLTLLMLPFLQTSKGKLYIEPEEREGIFDAIEWL